MQITNLVDKLPIGFINIHKEAFNNFFLTSLGDSFLKLYYSSVINSPKGLVICLFDNNNNLVGFAAGTYCSKGFHKEILLNNFFSYVWVLFNVVLFRPKAIIRLFKNLNKRKNIEVDKGMYAELLSIAVPPEYKGMGYGKILLKAFETELKYSDSDKIALTTDFINNENVLSFYEKSGYKLLYEFTTYPNRKMVKLIKELH
jgi:GNAT superfamily N-acetyltransferase